MTHEFPRVILVSTDVSQELQDAGDARLYVSDMSPEAQDAYNQAKVATATGEVVLVIDENGRGEVYEPSSDGGGWCREISGIADTIKEI